MIGVAEICICKGTAASDSATPRLLTSVVRRIQKARGSTLNLVAQQETSCLCVFNSAQFAVNNQVYPAILNPVKLVLNHYVMSILCH